MLSPNLYKWSISACLHLPSVIRALSCACSGGGERLDETLTAAQQSMAAAAASKNAFANDDDDDAPPCCIALALVEALALSSEELTAPNLVGRLTDPEGESTAMVTGRMRGRVRRERRAQRELQVCWLALCNRKRE